MRQDVLPELCGGEPRMGRRSAPARRRGVEASPDLYDSIPATASEVSSAILTSSECVFPTCGSPSELSPDTGAAMGIPKRNRNESDSKYSENKKRSPSLPEDFHCSNRLNCAQDDNKLSIRYHMNDAHRLKQGRGGKLLLRTETEDARGQIDEQPDEEANINLNQTGAESMLHGCSTDIVIQHAHGDFIPAGSGGRQVAGQGSSQRVGRKRPGQRTKLPPLEKGDVLFDCLASCLPSTFLDKEMKVSNAEPNLGLDCSMRKDGNNCQDERYVRSANSKFMSTTTHKDVKENIKGNGENIDSVDVHETKPANYDTEKRENIKKIAENLVEDNTKCETNKRSSEKLREEIRVAKPNIKTADTISAMSSSNIDDIVNRFSNTFTDAVNRITSEQVTKLRVNLAQSVSMRQGEGGPRTDKEGVELSGTSYVTVQSHSAQVSLHGNGADNAGFNCTMSRDMTSHNLTSVWSDTAQPVVEKSVENRSFLDDVEIFSDDSCSDSSMSKYKLRGSSLGKVDNLIVGECRGRAKRFGSVDGRKPANNTNNRFQELSVKRAFRGKVYEDLNKNIYKAVRKLTMNKKAKHGEQSSETESTQSSVTVSDESMDYHGFKLTQSSKTIPLSEIIHHHNKCQDKTVDLDSPAGPANLKITRGSNIVVQMETTLCDNNHGEFIQEEKYDECKFEQNKHENERSQFRKGNYETSRHRKRSNEKIAEHKSHSENEYKFVKKQKNNPHVASGASARFKAMQTKNSLQKSRQSVTRDTQSLRHYRRAVNLLQNATFPLTPAKHSIHLETKSALDLSNMPSLSDSQATDADEPLLNNEDADAGNLRGVNVTPSANKDNYSIEPPKIKEVVASSQKRLKNNTTDSKSDVKPLEICGKSCLSSLRSVSYTLVNDDSKSYVDKIPHIDDDAGHRKNSILDVAVGDKTRPCVAGNDGDLPRPLVAPRGHDKSGSHTSGDAGGRTILPHIVPTSSGDVGNIDTDVPHTKKSNEPPSLPKIKRLCRQNSTLTKGSTVHNADDTQLKPYLTKYRHTFFESSETSSKEKHEGNASSPQGNSSTTKIPAPIKAKPKVSKTGPNGAKSCRGLPYGFYYTSPYSKDSVQRPPLKRSNSMQLPKVTKCQSKDTLPNRPKNNKAISVTNKVQKDVTMNHNTTRKVKTGCPFQFGNNPKTKRDVSVTRKNSLPFLDLILSNEEKENPAEKRNRRCPLKETSAARLQTKRNVVGGGAIHTVTGGGECDVIPSPAPRKETGMTLFPPRVEAKGHYYPSKNVVCITVKPLNCQIQKENLELQVRVVCNDQQPDVEAAKQLVGQPVRRRTDAPEPEVLPVPTRDERKPRLGKTPFVTEINVEELLAEFGDVSAERQDF